MSDYELIHKGDGTVSVRLKAAKQVEAEMLVSAYVPDFQELGLTFAEAYDLACERDKEAADGLEMDCCNGTPDLTPAERAYAEKVNALFAQAEEEDAAQAEQEYHFIVSTLLDVPAVGVAV